MSAWLTGLRSARTRRAYAGDVAAWLGWLARRDTGVLAAGRVHMDLWAATQLDAGARPSLAAAAPGHARWSPPLARPRRCRAGHHAR